jgi:hypothetical protein
MILLAAKKITTENNFWIRSTAGFYCFLYFAGLITLSFISSWLCLFLPMRFSYLLLLSIAPLLFLFLKRKETLALLKMFPLKLNLSWVELSFILICLAAFFIPGVLKPVNGDTQIYHVQIIRWFNEYGTVPGIANLFPRFGLGSSWFNLIAMFRIPYFSYENFTWLNTTTVIWFFVWLINNWRFHFSNKNSSSHQVMSHFYLLVILFSLLEWELFRDAASSTNYDFIVTALTLIAISFLLESILFPLEEKKFSFIFIVLCISVIPFKLSGIFLVLLLLFYLSSFLKIKYWIACLAAGIIIVSPLLIKNYITTGYPVYPVPVSFNDPDWKLPLEMTDYLRQYIHVSNRFYNSNSIDFKKVPELMQQSWIHVWATGLLFQQKIIIGLSLLSVALFFFKSGLSVSYKSLRGLFLVLILMATGWFFTAPSPRFGYGVLLVLAFFPICFYFGKYFTLQLHKPLIILTFFITGYYLYLKSQPFFEHPDYFVHTAKLEQPPARIITINGMNFNLPEIINNGWMRDCFNTPLPCICNENKYLKPRGTTLKEGFKMEPKPDSIFIRNYIY